MLSPLRLWREKEVSCGVSAFTLFLHFMQFHAPSWKVCRMSSVMTFTGSGHQVQECLRRRVNELLNLQLRPGRGEVQPAEVSFISERWGEEGEAGYIFTFRGDVGTGGDLWCHQMQASLFLSLPLFMFWILLFISYKSWTTSVMRLTFTNLKMWHSQFLNDTKCHKD